ncbi:uncharacterized protein LOC117337945 [Pecten maximus]|uniref:uncharacterized protein LOC117337945 n=1 Tax=Pecten maximus TaxID=6579 RepID=UPI0014583465|nr:uncharacterized protein LOC117337945 [Pecten maximus]
MILILTALIGIATSTPLRRGYCDDTTSLNLIYNLNEQDVENQPFVEFMRLLNIDINDNLNKDDLLFLLGNMCRQKVLTLAWLLRQAEGVCPHPEKIRNLIQPSGAVCDDNGNLTASARNALSSFVRVNKSVDCHLVYQEIYTTCEVDAMFNGDGPLYPELTLEIDIAEKTRINTAAIRCTLPQLGRLPPSCGSPADLKIFSLISELIQLQPIKLDGEVDFGAFSDVMT